MRVQITIDGETEEVELDPDLSKFSLRETVRLEEALGESIFEKLMGSTDALGNQNIPSSPKIIQAILWAKLASVYPDLGLSDFDLDMEEFVPSQSEDDSGVSVGKAIGQD